MNKDKETTIGEDCANSIAELSGRQALYVLYVLAEKNTTFATAIMEETKKVLFRPIQIEKVADSVCATLNGIPVEDCWDASGKQRDGYHDITEVAYEMLHDALQEFVAEVEKYHRVGRCDLEVAYLQGFILGLYKFDMHPTTDFYDYIQDDVLSFADELKDDWEKLHPELLSEKKALYAFFEKSCPKWKFLMQE